MRNHHRLAPPRSLVVLSCGLGMSCAAWAGDATQQDPSRDPPELAVAASGPAEKMQDVQSVHSVQTPLKGRPLASRQLGGQRGGSDVFSDMSLRGVVADNRAINAVTGSNLVSQGALAGMSGVPMLVQNTGNNVLIQNATIINVQLK